MSDDSDASPTAGAGRDEDPNASLPALFWDALPDNPEDHPDWQAMQAIADECTPEERAENFKVCGRPAPQLGGRREGEHPQSAVAAHPGWQRAARAAATTSSCLGCGRPARWRRTRTRQRRWGGGNMGGGGRPPARAPTAPAGRGGAGAVETGPPPPPRAKKHTTPPPALRSKAIRS